ncbi:carboxypeptidase-like regulatory domain-containing protein [Planctomicrobium sp. SH664]|uniref:carboxypeptidase-like regulatory domain-containing protein n=1 Tax=Planctomicrobium sp. SH664 TaxID=3448125 RepID=UPI003F5B1992
MRRLWVPLCCLTIPFLLLSCRNSTGLELVPVTGVVTYEDRPIANAQVVFLPQQGQPAVGQTNAEGRFELMTAGKTGAAPGQCQVSVTAFEWVRPVSRGEMEGLPREELAKLQKWPIPQKYGNAATSELVVVVTPDGPNQITLNLK